MNNEGKLRTFITSVNCLSILWNIITLLADKLTLNTVGILWVFNISAGILIVERYFPEIEKQWMRILFISIVIFGNLLALFMIFFEPLSPNSIVCFIFNILGFIISSIYFCFKEFEHHR